jgi:hypothetical protein
MALNITELEIQKIVEMLKHFFPENNLALAEEVKQKLDDLSLLQIERLKKIAFSSSEINTKSDSLMQNIQEVSSTLDNLKSKCDDLEKILSNQLPLDISSRYFEETAINTTPAPQ